MGRSIRGPDAFGYRITRYTLFYWSKMVCSTFLENFIRRFIYVLFFLFVLQVTVADAQVNEPVDDQEGEPDEEPVEEPDEEPVEEPKADAEPEPAPSSEPTPTPAEPAAAPEQPSVATEEPPSDVSSQSGSEPPTEEADSEVSEPESTQAEEPVVSEADAIGFGDSDADSLGFGEDDSESEQQTVTAAPQGSLSLDSFVRSQLDFWAERFNKNPWARARQNFDTDLRYKRSFDLNSDDLELRLVAGLHLEYDFAYLHQRESYDQATLDAYEYQIIGRETSLSLSYDIAEVTFGRQIVVWGEGIALSPVDVVNPWDFRDVYLTDLVDRRVAVLATKLGFYFGKHRLESMVVHESYFDLQIPPPMADFSPIRALLLEDPRIESALQSRELRYKHIPGRWVNQAFQVFQRYSYAGHGFDLSFYAASILDRQGVMSSPSQSDFINDVVDLEMWHPRYTMLAHSGSVPVDDLVLKWELAVNLNRSFNVTDTSVEGLSVDIEKHHQLAAMFGLQYMDIVEDANLFFEYEQHYVFDNPEREDDSSIEFQLPAEQPQFAVVWQQTFLDERLSLDIFALLFGIWQYSGWFARVSLTYELIDNVKAGIGYATFQPDNDKFGPLYGMNSHDRILLNLRWDFLLQ